MTHCVDWLIDVVFWGWGGWGGWCLVGWFFLFIVYLFLLFLLLLFVWVYFVCLVFFLIFFLSLESFSLIWRCHQMLHWLLLSMRSTEDSFTYHNICDKGPPFLRLYPKYQWFLLLNAEGLAKEQSLPILMSFVCCDRDSNSWPFTSVEDVQTDWRTTIYCMWLVFDVIQV
jgi:hypothetical protein